MNFDSFKTVSGEGRSEFSRRGSRFVGICLPSSEDEYENQWVGLKNDYSDSTHVCYGAVTITNDRPVERYQNDGEPSGTAGEPILQVIKGKDLYQVAVFVVRYFGGTKLGTGGLVRAYGGAAKLAVDDSQIVLYKRRKKMKVSYPYSLTGPVMRFIKSEENAIKVDGIEYGEMASASLRVPVDRAERIKNELIEISSGRAEISIEDRS